MTCAKSNLFLGNIFELFFEIFVDGKNLFPFLLTSAHDKNACNGVLKTIATNISNKGNYI